MAMATSSTRQVLLRLRNDLQERAVARTKLALETIDPKEIVDAEARGLYEAVKLVNAFLDTIDGNR